MSEHWHGDEGAEPFASRRGRPGREANPWHKAGASFAAFTVGALLPLLAIRRTAGVVAPSTRRSPPSSWRCRRRAS